MGSEFLNREWEKNEYLFPYIYTPKQNTLDVNLVPGIVHTQGYNTNKKRNIAQDMVTEDSNQVL